MMKRYCLVLALFSVLLTSCSAIQNQEAAGRDRRKILKGLSVVRREIKSVAPAVSEEIKRSKKDLDSVNDKLSYIEKEILNLKINQANQLRDSGGSTEILEQINSKLEEYNYRVSTITQRMESIDSRISQLSDVYKSSAEREDKYTSEERLLRKREEARWANMGDSILAIQTSLAELQTFVDALGAAGNRGKSRGVKPPPFKASLKHSTGGKTTANQTGRPRAAGSGAAATKPQSRIVSIAPGQLYNTAYEDYLKGNFNLAISEFKEYLKKYPATEASANAIYWMGESLFAKKNYTASIDAFNRLQQKYPQSIKIPSAMLKTSYCYIKLNKPEKAREILEALVSDFPNSGESDLARDTLRDLKK